MNQTIYSHLQIDSTWGSSIILYNASNMIQTPHISLLPAGLIRTYTVLPKQRYTLDEGYLSVLLQNSSAPFACSILAPSCVIATVGLYVKENGGIKFYNTIQGKLSSDPESFYSVFSQDQWTHLQTEVNPDKSWLKAPYAHYVDYYSRMYDIGIGDCSNGQGTDLEGHPAGTHSSGKSFDFNYPTISGGSTHYPVITETLFAPDGQLIKERLDHRRLFNFCSTLNLRLGMTFLMDERIVSYMISLYGASSGSMFTGTPAGQNNHDKHAHGQV